MSKNFAYIRISDKYRQDGMTQRNSIQEYAEKNMLIIDEWVEEKVSGSKTKAADRQVSRIIADLDTGDKLICTEISRLGRDKPFSIISIINEITETHQAELHLTYTEQSITPENVENAEVLFTVVGASYHARQEAIRRAERAKAACDRRTRQGLANGRPAGLLVKTKLDAREDYIVRALNDQAGKSQLARDLEVGRSTLIRWIESRNRIREMAIKNFGMKPKNSITEMKTVLNKQEKLHL